MDIVGRWLEGYNLIADWHLGTPVGDLWADFMSFVQADEEGGGPKDAKALGKALRKRRVHSGKSDKTRYALRRKPAAQQPEPAALGEVISLATGKIKSASELF
jgi:hypothetical protein